MPPAVAAPHPGRSSLDQAGWDLRLNAFTLLLHSAVQAAELVGWHALPPSERAQRLGSCLLLLLPVLLSGLAPCLYLRHRKLIVVSNRVVFFSFPLLRKPRGIQRALDVAARPGPRGLLSDLLRVVWGSRLVAVLLAGVTGPLPLALHCAVASFEVLQVRANGSLCATPLLTHELSVARIQAFHSAMHALGLPAGTGVLTSAALGAGARARCEAFLSFTHLMVGLVLGTLLVVKTRAFASAKSWLAAPGNSSSGGGTSPLAAAAAWADVRLEAAAHVLAGGSWLRLGRDTAGGGDGSDSEEHTLGCTGLLLSRALAWWLLLSFVYAVAVAVS